MIRKWLTGYMIITVLLMLLTGCSQEPTHLTIGLIPSSNPEKMKTNFEPIRQYLEKETGISIEVFVPVNYMGLIEAMKNKKVDIGWYGAFSYIAAADEMSLEPMVIQYRSDFGITYHSLIVTRSDSGIERLDQLKGHSFAFVDPGSTSGFVIPYSLFKSRNIDYASYLGEVTYVGSHDRVLTSVMSKQADAGAMEDITFSKMINEQKPRQEDVRVLWQSNQIPGSPFVARSDLHPNLKSKFKNAMFSLHEKSPEAMRAFDSKIKKYVECSDSLYNDIRNISNILGKQFIIDNFLKTR